MAKTARKARKASGAKKAKTSAKKRSTQKRDRVKAKNASFYAKRSTRGRFKEMDEVGRSQRTDRKRKAKRKVKSGYGDKGDQ